MFKIPLLLTPSLDNKYAIQGDKQFPCFGWLNQDNSHLKESGILSLNWSASFLTCMNRKCGPFPLKGGSLIHPKTRLDPSTIS